MGINIRTSDLGFKTRCPNPEKQVARGITALMPNRKQADRNREKLKPYLQKSEQYCQQHYPDDYEKVQTALKEKRPFDTIATRPQEQDYKALSGGIDLSPNAPYIQALDRYQKLGELYNFKRLDAHMDKAKDQEVKISSTDMAYSSLLAISSFIEEYIDDCIRSPFNTQKLMHSDIMDRLKMIRNAQPFNTNIELTDAECEKLGVTPEEVENELIQLQKDKESLIGFEDKDLSQLQIKLKKVQTYIGRKNAQLGLEQLQQDLDEIGYGFVYDFQIPVAKEKDRFTPIKHAEGSFIREYIGKNEEPFYTLQGSNFNDCEVIYMRDLLNEPNEQCKKEGLTFPAIFMFEPEIIFPLDKFVREFKEGKIATHLSDSQFITEHYERLYNNRLTEKDEEREKAFIRANHHREMAKLGPNTMYTSTIWDDGCNFQFAQNIFRYALGQPLAEHIFEQIERHPAVKSELDKAYDPQKKVYVDEKFFQKD